MAGDKQLFCRVLADKSSPKHGHFEIFRKYLGDGTKNPTGDVVLGYFRNEKVCSTGGYNWKQRFPRVYSLPAWQGMGYCKYNIKLGIVPRIAHSANGSPAARTQ